MKTPPTILVIPTGGLLMEAIARLESKGILVIQADEPEKVRVIQGVGVNVAGCELSLALLDAIEKAANSGNSHAISAIGMHFMQNIHQTLKAKKKDERK